MKTQCKLSFITILLLCAAYACSGGSGSDSGGNSSGGGETSVTGIALNKNSTIMLVNGTEQLTATISPDSATNQNLSWSSSNETAASVSSEGLVTGLAEGSTIITATTEDGSYQDTCDVTVTTIDKINLYLTGITAGQDKITFTWDDPEGSFLDHIKISYTDGAASNTVSIDSGVETCELSSLAEDTEYTITMKILCTEGSSSENEPFVVSTTTGSSMVFLIIYTTADLNAVRGGVTGFSEFDLDKNYFLMADIDLSAYSTDEGWVPLGNDIDQFTGTFKGNDHVISNLTINRPSSNYQGLFGVVGSGSRIENLGIININVTGNNYTGGLMGYNDGAIVSISYAIGNVTGNGYTGGLVGRNMGIVSDSYATGNVTGESNTGGLVGWNEGSIGNSYTTGNVTGDYSTGGLIGDNLDTGFVVNSYSTGNVIGNAGTTGGLVACNLGLISDSYSTGNVTGTNYSTGGLLGYNISIVTSCYATGDVTGTNDYTGGLVGLNEEGTVSDSFATGNVTGHDYTGGLVGVNTGAVSDSYATGNVNGNNEYAGGLVGQNFVDGTISDSYATGDVTGNDGTGGLVGQNIMIVTNSYAIGNVTGIDRTGGLVGDNSGIVATCYSTGDMIGNIVTTGGIVGINNGIIDSSFYYKCDNGLETFTTIDEMQDQDLYTGAGWDFTSTWSIDSGINSGFPYLTAIPPE